ncbi:MAG TPA: flagellar motor switch protein FliN [Tepidisphaeraceae bacterium]|jgi:flagellar motor switch protein FliN/FliY|nr:flagellar motor switch protein FliN [Tepidisphaeraceae bacterium]
MAEDPAPAPPSDPLEPAATTETPSTEASAAATPPAEAAPPEPAAVELPAGEAPATESASAATATAVADDGAFDQAAIDELLKQANFEDPSTLPADAAAALPDTSSFELPNFQQAIQDAQVSSIDLLRDVELNVKIELGRSRMLVEDVLKLGEGSVVELDKLAGDPVDVFVNDRLVARGEVLVLNDNFCVRVNEIVAGAKDDLP